MPMQCKAASIIAKPMQCQCSANVIPMLSNAGEKQERKILGKRRQEEKEEEKEEMENTEI